MRRDGPGDKLLYPFTSFLTQEGTPVKFVPLSPYRYTQLHAMSASIRRAWVAQVAVIIRKLTSSRGNAIELLPPFQVYMRDVSLHIDGNIWCQLDSQSKDVPRPPVTVEQPSWVFVCPCKLRFAQEQVVCAQGAVCAAITDCTRKGLPASLKCETLIYIFG